MVVTDPDAPSRKFREKLQHHPGVEVVRIVREKGPDSQEAQLLMGQLYEYAIPVMHDFIRTKSIIAKVNEMGRSINAAALDGLSDVDRIDLVTDVIMRAGRLFLSTFIFGEQRWRPGSASITTTFINACILVFPSEFRKVSRVSYLRASNEILVAEMLDFDRQRAAAKDPERQIVAKLELEEELARLTIRERQIFLLHDEGYNFTEIAFIIGAHPDAVRKTFARARTKIRNDHVRRSIELADREPAGAELTAKAWELLEQWGVNTLQTAYAVKEIIDGERSTFENSRFPALYRPFAEIPYNMLDIILDHIDVDVPWKDYTSWTAKQARVTRRVLDAIRAKFPSVNRPNPKTKGAVLDLQRFYDSLKLVCAP